MQYELTPISKAVPSASFLLLLSNVMCTSAYSLLSLKDVCLCVHNCRNLNRYPSNTVKEPTLKYLITMAVKPALCLHTSRLLLWEVQDIFCVLFAAMAFYFTSRKCRN